MDRIELWNVQVAASGPQFVINSVGITIPDRRDDIVTQTVRDCGENAFEIAPTFEEVRIQQIGIKRILLDMLPVSSNLPTVPSGNRAIDQPQAVVVANSKSDLVGRYVMGLSSVSK